MNDVWEQAAEQYEAYYQNQYKRADKLEKQLLTKLLKQFPNATTLLEIGCGTAHFTKWLSTVGLECVGLDRSGGMLKQAKKLWTNETLLKGDGSRIPLQDKSVDLVAFITSLEFIEKPDSALTEAVRVARKGLILGLLNKQSAATLKRKIGQPENGSVYSQAKYYSFKDIKEKLYKINCKYSVASWGTTVFPGFFGNLESTFFPYGDFLAVAFKFEN